MTLTYQQIIAMLPLLIVGLTVVVVMLSVAVSRDHFRTCTLSMIGLHIAWFSLLLVWQVQPLAVTPLLQVDGFSMLYSFLVIFTGLSICTFAYTWLMGYNDNRDEFYLLVLIACAGGLLLANASHLASFFLGIELLSLPLFGMVGYTFRQPRTLEASIKYTLLSAVASSFLLFGMALIYAESGNLSFVALGHSLNSHLLHEPLLLIGLGMMVVGIGFKLSLVPFHLWTPDVYQGAPAPVSAFLATGSKIAIFAATLRLFLYAPVSHSEAMRIMLGVISFISIIFGNLMALTQSNIKRMMGYSSIAHMGYLLVALIGLESGHLAMETVGVYLTGYMFSSMAVFGVISLMSSPYSGQDAESLYSFRGLFWHRPILAAAMTVALLSMAGIPMTVGFIGKFYVLALGVHAHLWWLTAAVILGSAIGLYYYLRTTVSLYLLSPRRFSRDTPSDWAFTAGGIVVLVSAVLVVLLGLYPQPLISLVRYAHPFF